MRAAADIAYLFHLDPIAVLETSHTKFQIRAAAAEYVNQELAKARAAAKAGKT